MADLYEELGVDRGATQDDIKRAFRSQARKNHPDNGGDKEKMQALIAAYEVLGDEERRQRYDETGDTGSGNRRSVEQTIGQMLDEAFMQDGQDPIRWIKNRIDAGRSQFKMQSENVELRIKKIQGKLDKFKKANAKTKNRAGYDLVCIGLQRNIELMHQESKGCLAEVAFATEMLTFLNDLQESGGEYRDFGSWGSVGTFRFKVGS
jgi:curved DNA-binding protein CbpA